MSVGFFAFGDQQASQLSRIGDKHKIELENLRREKTEEAAASAKEISGLRNRINALEAQLGNGKAGNALSSASEIRIGAENLAGTFSFCPPHSYVFPLFIVQNYQCLALRS
jgi:beta-phosphoglucomutase-like phosphatase (HAD superfamily)